MQLLAPFDISPRALEEVKTIKARKNIPEEYALRLGIKGSAGCVGVAYLIGFDKPKDTDVHYELDGVEILMDKRHALYLAGVRVDWLDKETERGFAFIKGDVPSIQEAKSPS